MYILLNSTVKMGTGKAVAQGGHGISAVTEIMIKHYPEIWKKYTKQSDHTKIVLACPQHVMESFLEKYEWTENKQINENHCWCIKVIDAGRTQVEPGTMTAIIFCPMTKVDAPELFETLKLNR